MDMHGAIQTYTGELLFFILLRNHNGPINYLIPN
jgi:hypothetical protein